MVKKIALICAAALIPLGTSQAAASTLDSEGSETLGTATAVWSIASGAGEVTAQSTTYDADDDGWQFSVTPYLWASGAKADITTRQGEEVDVDSSFFDILGDLKFAFMGAFDARNGRFVTVHDLIFLSMSTSADANIGPIPLEADVDMKLLSTTHLIGYRVVDKGPMFLDLMAGARINSIKVDLTLSGPLQEVNRDNSRTTIGPVIASRFRMPLGGNWAAALYGDVGGFGVTSDISWQLLGTIQYDISDRWRLAAGWRHFTAHQDKNDFDVDMKLDGPILGATYRF